MRNRLGSKTAFAVVMVLALAVTVSLAISALAQDATPVKTNAQMGKAGASDPNVKKAEASNDPKAAAGKAPGHRGASTRGFGPGVCGVVVENWTNLYVKVYVDGTFRGSMGPYDEGVVYTGSGATTVYSRADFTDGSYRYWGPRVVSCPQGGRSIWELH